MESEPVVAKKKAEPKASVPTRKQPPAQPTRKGARRATLHRILGEHPRMQIKALAKAVYGADDRKAQNALRSLLSSEAEKGRVRNVGDGKWEVTGSALAPKKA